jgi:hypothetical protein
VLLGLSENCRNHVHDLASYYQQQPHANIYTLGLNKRRLVLTNWFNEDLTEALAHWNKLSDKLEKGDRKVLGKLMEVTAEISEELARKAVFIRKQKVKKGMPILAPRLALSKNGLMKVLLPSRLDRSIKTLIDDTNALLPDLQQRSPNPRVGGSSDFARTISGYKKRRFDYKQILIALHKSGRFDDWHWLEDHGCKDWMAVRNSADERRAFQKYIGHFPKF